MSAALELLRRCVTPAGLLAAVEERTNYRRVWARDGCICGLAALAQRDTELIAALRTTLTTLAKHQGAAGQIPSNVAVDGRDVSFGTSVGRVDATAWFIVASCLYGRLVDDSLVDELWPALERAAAVLRAWEMNDAGLLYVPVSGDWADEYLLSGYLLYDQLVRLWGQRELAAAGERLQRSVEPHPRELATLIADRFHSADTPYLLAGFQPGTIHQQFDAFGNALACILEVGSIDDRHAALKHAASLARFDLVPAFHPTIEPDDPRYQTLRNIAGARLRNEPGRYHNGGLWPVVTGFWAVAAARLGEHALARRFAEGIERANRLAGGGFHEYLDARSGEPGGVRGQAWSAAGELLAQAFSGSTPGPPAADLF
jgi:hypothetical protein